MQDTENNLMLRDMRQILILWFLFRMYWVHLYGGFPSKR